MGAGFHQYQQLLGYTVDEKKMSLELYKRLKAQSTSCPTAQILKKRSPCYK